MKRLFSPFDVTPQLDAGPVKDLGLRLEDPRLVGPGTERVTHADGGDRVDRRRHQREPDGCERVRDEHRPKRCFPTPEPTFVCLCIGHCSLSMVVD